ncbi:hypothetical protein SLA2020_461650 [Shorea laevis]
MLCWSCIVGLVGLISILDCLWDKLKWFEVDESESSVLWILLFSPFSLLLLGASGAPRLRDVIRRGLSDKGHLDSKEATRNWVRRLPQFVCYVSKD